MFLPHVNGCQSTEVSGATPGYVGLEIRVAS